MPTELKVPAVGESITEVQIGSWLKQEGDSVSADEALVELESDKATVELPAPIAGVIEKILKASGETAAVGEVIGYLAEQEPGAESKSESKSEPESESESEPDAAPEAEAEAPADDAPAPGRDGGEQRVLPAAARAAHDAGLDVASIEGTGPGGRVLKEDVQREAAVRGSVTASRPAPQAAPAGAREEEVVPMSTLRKRIAANLVQAQQAAALLTTFNEVDMTALQALRKQHKQAFEERYGVRLGLMSFFVKAVVDALKAFPAVNAEVRDDQIVYRHYQDVGVAVGGGKGLVVPVLRNAESMSFAEIEQAIGDFGARAQSGKLKPDELQGGTFTISNGGVYGSLLSTPIVNPPQSGILGLHGIQERPVVRDGQVVARPMMYVALTYDHRVVDGREAVSFLVRVKDCIEDPARMLLEI